MFIIAGRAGGAIAGLACATIVAVLLGGCATNRNDAAAGIAKRIHRPTADSCSTSGARLCMTYGPTQSDKRCSCDQSAKVQNALDALQLQ